MGGSGIELEVGNACRYPDIAHSSQDELATRCADAHLVTGPDAELPHRLRGKAQHLGPGQWRERLG